MNQRREAMNLQQASHIVCSPLDCETGILLKSGDHDHWDRDSSFYSIGSPTFLTTKVKMILVSLVESLQTSMMFRAGTTNLSQGSGRAWLWVWPRCWAQRPPKNGFGRCVYDIHIYIITTVMIMTFAIVIVILLSCYTMIIVLVVISSAFLPLTLFLHDIWRDMNRLSLDFHRQYPFLRCLVVTGNHFFMVYPLHERLSPREVSP
jgi:hypothetical protein